MPVFYVSNRVAGSDQEHLTVFVPGHQPATADNTHPNWHAIKDALRDPDVDESVLDLFDVGQTVAERFDSLSERVTFANGHVYFDGDEVHDALTAQIVRFLNEDVSDWIPLVHFFEKVQTNPEPHSREQLYEWLDRHEFAITSSGDFVAYKGVVANDDGTYKSVNSGPGIVNGEAQNGQLQNNPGDIVEIPRSQVHHDPAVGCSAGLHVATHEFASSWARGALLKVTVNPRDVVSVPTECNAQKIRVSRYHVEDVIDLPVTSAFDEEPNDWDYGDDPDYDPDDGYY